MPVAAPTPLPVEPFSVNCVALATETVHVPLAAVFTACPAIVIEKAEQAQERALFHLYNLMRERRGHLLLLSAEPPARWTTHLPDLASRLRAAPAIAVAPPDDELLGSLILKQLADRQLHAGPGVVRYLVTHMERSAEAVRRVVAALDRKGLAERREIDRRLAADVLAELSGGKPQEEP